MMMMILMYVWCLYVLFVSIYKSVWLSYYSAKSHSYATITVLALIIIISVYCSASLFILLLSIPLVIVQHLYFHLFVHGPLFMVHVWLCVVVCQVVLRCLPVDLLYVFVIDLRDIVLLWFVLISCVFCLWCLCDVYVVGSFMMIMFTFFLLQCCLHIEPLQQNLWEQKHNFWEHLGYIIFVFACFLALHNFLFSSSLFTPTDGLQIIGNIPLLGWFNNKVASWRVLVPVESFVSLTRLYVDHLWYQNISLVCVLQILYIFPLVHYPGGGMMMKTPAQCLGSCRTFWIYVKQNDHLSTTLFSLVACILRKKITHWY